MTGRQVLIAAWLICGAMAAAPPRAGAVPSPPQLEPFSAPVNAGAIRLAQAAPAQPPAPQAPAAATAPSSTAAPDAVDPVGIVATLTGVATVTRNNNTAAPLKLNDDIFKNDVLQTLGNSTLGVTFNDETTFNLTANARVTVDNYIYEDGGSNNAALFNIAKGTVAFVASAVARTGDMKIETPTATLGIRGTTGLVEVPEGAATAGQNNVAIKLLSRSGRQGRPHRGQRPRRHAAGSIVAGRHRLCDPTRRRRPFCRAADFDLAAAGGARSRHCPAGSRRASRWPASRRPATQRDPQQSGAAQQPEPPAR